MIENLHGLALDWNCFRRTEPRNAMQLMLAEHIGGEHRVAQRRTNSDAKDLVR